MSPYETGRFAVQMAHLAASGSRDIASIGSEIEHGSSELASAFARECERIRFFSEYAERCALLGNLEAFARAMCTAKCERLAGRIDQAMLAEAEAERAYKRLPEGDRW